MGDMREVFDAMKEAREERRASRLSQNWATLNAWRDAHGIDRLDTRNGGTVVLFRDGAKKADFYPGTGRWRSGGKTYRGGAASFLAWWSKQ